MLEISRKLGLEGTHNLLGQYSYVQWGYHMADTPPFPVINGTEYELINRFWFVEGFPTDSTDIAAMSGAYTYSGVVHGTYYSKTDQADLVGSYSTEVDFGASHIKDFHLTASGGGHSISFSQSGTDTIHSAGEFHIDDPDGTFKIDGNAVDHWNVSGAHFGPGAAEQAGSYAAHCPSSNIGAWGVFVGQKGP